MNKIRAVMWREYMLSKKKIFLGFGLFFIFSLLCCLFIISLDHGNVAMLLKDEQPSTKQDTINSIFTMTMFIPLFGSVPLLEENGIIVSDMKSGWSLFSFSLPVKPSQEMMAKYIMKTILVAVYIILNLLHFLIISSLAGKNIPSYAYSVLFLFIDFILLSELIKGALLYRAKNEKQASTAAVAAPFATALLLVAYGFSLMDDFKSITAGKEGESGFSDLLEPFKFFQRDIELISPFLIPIMAALLIGGYFIHLAVFKRRNLQ